MDQKYVVVAKIEGPPFFPSYCCEWFIGTFYFIFGASYTFLWTNNLGCTKLTSIFNMGIIPLILLYLIKLGFLKTKFWNGSLHDVFSNLWIIHHNICRFSRLHKQIIIHGKKSPWNWTLVVWFPKCIGTRSNPHTLFLYFWSSKNICNLTFSSSNITKIAQFGKGMGKIWNVWCKGFQCLVMGQLK